MNAAWFFSTLSQSTAAVVGFIIAVTTVTYSIERQKQMEQVSNFNRELNEIREKYVTALDQLQAQYSSDLDQEIRSDVVDAFNSRPEDHNKNAIEPLSYLERSDVPSQFYYLLMLITGQLVSRFQYQSTPPELHHIEEVSAAADTIRRDFLSSRKNSEEIVRVRFPDIESSKDGGITRVPLFDSVSTELEIGDFGRIETLEDLESLLASLMDDLAQPRNRYNMVYADYTSTHVDILNISIYLVFTGVFLPMLFLLTPPVQIPFIAGGMGIFIAEVFILLSTLILTFGLLQLVMHSFQSNTRSEPSPGRLAIALTTHLPLVI